MNNLGGFEGPFKLSGKKYSLCPEKPVSFCFGTHFKIQVSNAKTSRSYTAVATQGSVSDGVGRSNTMLKKGGDEPGKRATTSWIPDPVIEIY
nr:protein SENESCENCE-ASSOCIATED GENE 21, mitochondrial-like [Ipomoea batatas]